MTLEGLAKLTHIRKELANFLKPMQTNDRQLFSPNLSFVKTGRSLRRSFWLAKRSCRVCFEESRVQRKGVGGNAFLFIVLDVGNEPEMERLSGLLRKLFCQFTSMTLPNKSRLRNKPRVFQVPVEFETENAADKAKFTHWCRSAGSFIDLQEIAYHYEKFCAWLKTASADDEGETVNTTKFYTNEEVEKGLSLLRERLEI